MEIIVPILYVYFGVGFIYAMYIWLFAGDTWVSIPINILGGPLVLIWAILTQFTRKHTDLKSLFKNKKGVIFDLDGTIIDSQPYRDQAMENVLESLDSAWIFPSYVSGLNERKKWKHIMDNEPEFKPGLTVDQLAEKTKQEYLKIYQDVKPLPGFWEFARYLKETRNFKLGLATNSERDVTTEILKRFSAENVFDFIATADDVVKHKPHPDIYKKVLQGLKLRAKDVVAFEDTIVGATSARDAGIEVIVIWDGEDEDPEDFPPGIRYFIPDFRNLESSIEKTGEEEILEISNEIKKDNFLVDPEAQEPKK